jgi:hypothetical protein
MAVKYAYCKAETGAPLRWLPEELANEIYASDELSDCRKTGKDGEIRIEIPPDCDEFRISNELKNFLTEHCGDVLHIFKL